MIRDDFTGGFSDSSGGIGETGWSIYSTADAGHSINYSPGEAGHPGICVVSCAPLANSIVSCCKHKPNAALINPFLSDDIIEMIFVVRPLSTNNERILVGAAQDPILATSNVLNGGPNAVYAFYDPAVSANWLFRTRTLSTNTDTDTGVALVGSRWYEMRFSRIGSNWQLRIGANGVLSATFTNSTNLPAGGLNPCVGVQATTASSRVVHLDYWEIFSGMNGLPRQRF